MKDSRDIILSTQLTEKGSRLMADENKYLFIVSGAANKTEVKRAVEDLYKVKVRKVNTMNYEGKKRRERTVQYGSKSDWKRAVVTLRDGEKIDFV